MSRWRAIPAPSGLAALCGTPSSTFLPLLRQSHCRCRRQQIKKQRVTCLQRVLDPEGPSRQAVVQSGVEARQVLLDVRPKAEPPLW